MLIFNQLNFKSFEILNAHIELPSLFRTNKFSLYFQAFIQVWDQENLHVGFGMSLIHNKALTKHKRKLGIFFQQLPQRNSNKYIFPHHFTFDYVGNNCHKLPDTSMYEFLRQLRKIFLHCFRDLWVDVEKSARFDLMRRDYNLA